MPIETPPTMRALVVSRLAAQFAGCSVQVVPTPSPGPGELLIRIRAGSVGFPDLLMTTGGYQHLPDLPFTPGGDMAGEVVAVGPGNASFALGARVVATRLGGAFAEYGVYAEETLRLIPVEIDFATAAAAGAAYLTAYVALVRRAEIKPGEWILVHGAAGGVGLAAVDLAKALGARVIAASASKDKLRAIGELYGPEVLLDSSVGFREQVKQLTGGGADVIFDPVGGDVFDESVRCIGFNGRLLVVGFTSGRIPTLPVNMALIKAFSVLGVRAGEYGRRDPEKGRENMEAIWGMIGAGVLHPSVHATYPLAEWRAAFEDMAARRVVGRVVIAP